MKEWEALKKINEDGYKTLIWGLGYLYEEVGKDYLEKKGIEPDYFYDSCGNYSAIESNYKSKILQEGDFDKIEGNTVCFIFIGNGYDLTQVFERLEMSHITTVMTYTDICKSRCIQDQYFPNNDRIAVYTCITGDYDALCEPLIIDSNCDYYLISDKKPTHESIYKYININDVIPNELGDNIMKNRFCKMFPNIIFPEYRYSIYVDGNLQLKSELTSLVDDLPEIGLSVSTLHGESIITHGVKLVISKLDDKEIIVNQISKYCEEGMPKDLDVFLCNCLVRDHKNKQCIDVMNRWWESYREGCRRDQISFVYALWKNNIKQEQVGLLYKRDSKKYSYLHTSPYWNYINKHNKKFSDQIQRIDN